jgi:Tfp pilus assembly protein PilN
MRAVNLIPKDYRRGALAGRGGETLSYALIGGLAVVLVAVLAVILTGNQVSARQAQVAELKQQESDARQAADALQPFANFASLQQSRTATVSSLAQSRFDWERVMSELSKVLPGDIWLTKLTGKVVPGVSLDNEASLSARDNIEGPALEIVGCAPGQEQVAAFVAALEDIDGVTRVGVQSSDKPIDAVAGSAPGGGSSDECRTKESISKFEIVIAFDAAPVPAGVGDASAPPAAATPAAATTPTTPTSPDQSGVAQTQQQHAAEQQSVQQSSQKARKATGLVPGN